MWRSSSGARSVGAFVLVYGLLLAPWPGWNERYCAWLATLGRAAYSWENSRCIVRFDSVSRTPAQPLDLRIMVGNRALLDASQAGPARVMELDARSIGWIPTALLSALVFATPLPWLRRLRALAVALIGIHLYVLLAIGICLWNGVATSATLQLLAPSPLTATIAGALNQTFVVQMGTGFVVAASSWLLVIAASTSWWRTVGPQSIAARRRRVLHQGGATAPSTSVRPRAAR